MRRLVITTLLAAAALLAGAVATNDQAQFGGGPIPWCPPVCPSK
jgi:hypothetical protein